MPPAIFSHQGFVLPLKMRSPKNFDGMALLLGAAVPDSFVVMKFFVGHEGYQYFAHSLMGLIITFPLAILLSIIFSRWVMPWIATTEKKTTGFIRNIGDYFGLDEWDLLKQKQYNLRWLGVAAYSAFIGIISHFMLDLLGHHVNTLYITTPESPAYEAQIIMLPAWFGTQLGNTSFVQGNVIWLIEAILFAILCLFYMHIIKRDHLLLHWYGQPAPVSSTISVFNDEIVSDHLETPPFEPTWTGLNNNMAVSFWPPHIWVKCKPKNYFIVLAIIITGSFLIELIYQIVYPPRGDSPIYVRLMTISYVTGIFSIMAILFDEKYTRALVIIFIPFLALLVYTLIARNQELTDLYGPYFAFGALATHIWHFFVAGYLIFKKKWTDWQYLLNVGIVYFFYFSILWILDPDFKMVFLYDFTETLVFLTISVYVMTGLTFIIQYILVQGKPKP
jgi:hypothetical protein